MHDRCVVIQSIRGLHHEVQGVEGIPGIYRTSILDVNPSLAVADSCVRLIL